MTSKLLLTLFFVVPQLAFADLCKTISEIDTAPYALKWVLMKSRLWQWI